MAEQHHGSCLCGAVRFTVSGALPGPDACHCRMCAKHSGHVFASTDVPRTALTIASAEPLRWYQSSPKVRRGFCGDCGSSLFFDPPADRGWIAVAMGAFDGPSDTRLAKHIFVADKGDYYDIADDAPRE